MCHHCWFAAKVKQVQKRIADWEGIPVVQGPWKLILLELEVMVNAYPLCQCGQASEARGQN